MSAQNVDEQRDFAARVGVRFPLISDPARQLAATLGLPTFTVDGQTFYERLTLIAEAARIVEVFYPVFPPDRNAEEVVRWLSTQR